MSNERIELLKELSLAFGPTGCEENVGDIICQKAESYCHLYATDRMGNFVFKISPEVHNAHTKKIMICQYDFSIFLKKFIGGYYLCFYLKFSC